jgi:hypothetical protein
MSDDSDKKNIKLSKKFINGLKEKDIDYTELINYYTYCGGLSNIYKNDKNNKNFSLFEFEFDYYYKYYKDLDSRHLKYLQQYFNNVIPFNKLPISKNLKSFYIRKNSKIEILNKKNYKEEDNLTEIFKEIYYCVCKQSIKHLCFLHNKNYKDNKKPEYLLVGSCCITKFMPNGLSKNCSNCGEIHKNRKDNFCNNCRTNILNNFKLISNWEIKFGKHKGELYKDIPLDYLQFLYNKGFWNNKDYVSNDKIKKYVEYRINQSI